VLDELSALSVQAFLCEPANPDACGDEHGQAKERLRRSIAAESSGVWRLNQLHGLLDDLYPETLLPRPELLHFSQAMVCRQAGRALFDSGSGLVHKGTMLTRLPRHQHVPDVHSFRLDLIHANQMYPRLPKAVFLPSVNCIDREHWLKETQARLWPFDPPFLEAISGWPVILSGCNANHAYAEKLFERIRAAHCFPILEDDLPDRLIIDHAVVPMATYRVLAGFHKQYFETCRVSISVGVEVETQPNRPSSRGVFLKPQLTSVPEVLRSLIQPLAESLLRQGWTIVELETWFTPTDVGEMQNAPSILAFTAPGIGVLSTLGDDLRARFLVLIGDEVAVDDALQLRGQDANGIFIRATSFLSSDEAKAVPVEALMHSLWLEWLLETIDQALLNQGPKKESPD